MTRRIGTIVGLMVAYLLFNSWMSHCVGMQPQLGDPAKVSADDTVRQLVRQLASPDYAKRAVATTKLLEMGERAIPALEQTQ